MVPATGAKTVDASSRLSPHIVHSTTYSAIIITSSPPLVAALQQFHGTLRFAFSCGSECFRYHHPHIDCYELVKKKYENGEAKKTSALHKRATYQKLSPCGWTKF